MAVSAVAQQSRRSNSDAVKPGKHFYEFGCFVWTPRSVFCFHAGTLSECLLRSFASDFQYSRLALDILL